MNESYLRDLGAGADGLWREPTELRPCLRLAGPGLAEGLCHAGSISPVVCRMCPNRPLNSYVGVLTPQSLRL